MRERVREFLESKVGKDLVPECTTWARSAIGELFSTLGIPCKFEQEFNIWATGVLREMFGPEAVGLQSWETGPSNKAYPIPSKKRLLADHELKTQGQLVEEDEENGQEEQEKGLVSPRILS